MMITLRGSLTAGSNLSEIVQMRRRSQPILGVQHSQEVRTRRRVHRQSTSPSLLPNLVPRQSSGPSPQASPQGRATGTPARNVPLAQSGATAYT
jgi:hypothetical protein